MPRLASPPFLFQSLNLFSPQPGSICWGNTKDAKTSTCHWRSGGKRLDESARMGHPFLPFLSKWGPSSIGGCFSSRRWANLGEHGGPAGGSVRSDILVCSSGRGVLGLAAQPATISKSRGRFESIFGNECAWQSSGRDYLAGTGSWETGRLPSVENGQGRFRFHFHHEPLANFYYLHPLPLPPSVVRF